jgi:hypothetical protein
MDKLHAEVIWEAITYAQRIAITNSLYITEFRNGMAQGSWKSLSKSEQEALLKLDWEFILGKNFPQVKSK